MRALPSSLRKQLETSVLAARRAAEAASRAAIESLGVFADRRPEHLNAAQAALRNGLRAKWRQLGNDRDLLVAECAYEQWHRLLFARFLAENGLLLHPQFRAPVTLAECEELAADLGEPDAWSVAARFAAEILPGIFRLDDPCVRVRLGARRDATHWSRSSTRSPQRRSQPTTRWAGCTSSGRRTRRTRSTPRSARSAAPTWGR